jgi:uncharacterized protein YukE
MAELGETSDPRALIPGSPDAIEENARVLGARATAATDAGEGLRSIDTGSWTGAAATTFHDEFSYEPSKWLKAADCFNDASDALIDHASTLRWAHEQATERAESRQHCGWEPNLFPGPTVCRSWRGTSPSRPRGPQPRTPATRRGR